MLNFALIAMCIGAGWCLRRLQLVPADGHLSLNAWLIYVAIPAAALHYLPQVEWQRELWLPLVMPVLMWCGAYLWFGRSDHPGPTRGSLVLGSGLSNTSFVGFPLVSAYYGEAGLRIAVLCDQVSFVLLSSLGVLTAASASGQRSAPGTQLRQLLTFPPLVASLLALALPSWVGSPTLDVLWSRLAATLIPMALFSIGLQLRLESSAERRPLAQGLIYKLFLAPALVLTLALLAGQRGLPAKVSVLEAAMASMASTSVLAARYSLNLPLSNLLIGVGIPLSLLTTCLWWWVLEQLL